MRLKLFLPILAVGVLAVGAAMTVSALPLVSAQSPDPTQTTPTATPANPSTSPKQGWGKGFAMRGNDQQALADALGITVDKVQAAYQSATTEALKQAVTAGAITQAQADAITARGELLGPTPWLQAAGIDFNSLLANALGITEDQLKAGFQKAYDTQIDNAVANGNLTQAQADLLKGRYALSNSTQYQSAMQSAFQAAVQQAVTDGVITQAQADAILQNAQNAGAKGFEGFGFPGGPGFGRFGGFGGPHGRGGRGFNGPFVPNNPNNPNNPTPTPSGGQSF